MDQQYEKVTNHLGFSQYIDEEGEHHCPSCHVAYTNEGEGVLCKVCGQHDPE